MLQIVPTITTPELLKNNTAVPDTFAGLSNGIAKAGNVSTEPLNLKQPFFEHDVMWWDELGHSHPHLGFSSYDPAYIQRKIAAYKLRGITGANWLNQGPGGTQDKAALASKPLFEAAGLQFSLMISSNVPSLKNATTVATRTAAMNKLLDYYLATYFKSPAYSRYLTRPLLYCFGLPNADYDWTAVRNHVHAYGTNEVAFAFRMEDTYGAHLCADLYFAWTHFSEAWITYAKTFNKPLIGSANGGFNNSLAGWGTPNIILQNGGLRMQDQLAINRAHPELIQTLGVTGTDYEEGTAFEPGLASGQTLVLSESNGVLQWNDCGLVVARYQVLISKDGNGWMELGQPTTVQFDLKPLDIDEGTYQFRVRGITKPFVQNIDSNVVTASLGWTDAA